MSATSHTQAKRMSDGTRLRLELPATEVCMHMHIDGQVLPVELVGEQLPNGKTAYSAKIYLASGHTTVLPGEAGIYTDDEGYYAYPAPSERKLIDR